MCVYFLVAFLPLLWKKTKVKIFSLPTLQKNCGIVGNMIQVVDFYLGNWIYETREKSFYGNLKGKTYLGEQYV